jgi:hypothetical protein
MKLSVAEQVRVHTAFTKLRRTLLPVASASQTAPSTLPSLAPSSRQVRVSTLLLWLGVPCLPFMWLLNVGMFYGVYKSASCPPQVRRNVRLSFAGAMLWLLLALSWAVYFRVHAEQLQRWAFGTMWTYMWGGQV